MCPLPKIPQARDYEILGQIGEGGFGAVYQAYQPSIDRHVAIKVILPEYANDPEFIQRFEREAQFVARLEHPNIVPLYDYWRDQEGAFLVMRLLRGGNLSQALREGAWSLEQSARLLDQIATALDFAHRQGVVHRDIKPENIFFDEEGNAYLSDFGIAKALAKPSDLTMAGDIIGSLLYISPEQAQSKPVTIQSDLYSLGVVMYVVLTGQHPYRDETPASLLLKQIQQPLPALSDLRPDLPVDLDDVLQQMTAKEPADRYPNAQAYADAFRKAMSGMIQPQEKLLSEHLQEITPQLPTFLTEEIGAERVKPIFVSREKELARLDAFLDKTLTRNGSVVFVTGGPGRGKTALLNEFAHRSMKAHADLLVAAGNCNAYSGLGDAYLPFREVMGMLTGNVEALWSAGVIDTEHARRLWFAFPEVVQVLLERGPHLFETFVSAEELLARLTNAVPNSGNLSKSMSEMVTRSQTRMESLEQSHLFEQFTNVLLCLAEKHPLLVVLDDLQWADESSLSLLFHLGRRLQGACILIVGAYRPEEVALGREGKRHPLEKILSEFKGKYGDVWVDLSGAQEGESIEFVDALLDSEPNRLDQDFRQALYQHTAGHPLFTIELLRALQESGELQQDEAGCWFVSSSLDWSRLPARAEAVIEERIDRLENELREILSVASVEGENFTAQVVGSVQQVSERELLRILSGELEKRHRLVREQGEQIVGLRRLSRYRFAHALFQRYLYNQLGEAERRFLHHEIGRVLEELYPGQTDEIAEQLVYHFAGDAERERHYAIIAGERAARRFANVEALRYFSLAFELTSQDHLPERFDILIKREQILDLLADRTNQEQDLAILKQYTEKMDDDVRKIDVLLRYAQFSHNTSDLEAAIKYAKEAIQLAGSCQDTGRQSEGYLYWGRATWQQGDLKGARNHIERSLELSRVAGRKQIEAHALRVLGILSQDFEENSFYEQALQICRQLGDHSGETLALNNLGVNASYSGHTAAGKPYYEDALAISRKIGDRHYEWLFLFNLAEVYLHSGYFSISRDYSTEGLTIAREIGDRVGEGTCLFLLGNYYHVLGAYSEAKNILTDILEMTREIGIKVEQLSVLGRLSLTCHQQGEKQEAFEYLLEAAKLGEEVDNLESKCLTWTCQGYVYEGLGDPEKAAYAYQQVLESTHKIKWQPIHAENHAGLARLSLEQGDISQAQQFVSEILSKMENRVSEMSAFLGDELRAASPFDEALDPFAIYLTCYRVLQASGDTRADEILCYAYKLLQERAANIQDKNLRNSYLNIVPSHKEIMREWAEQDES